MDNNEHRITSKEVQDGNEQAYYIVKKCLDCQISNPDYSVEAFDMPIPTLEAAKELIKGFTDIGMKQHPNARYEDGILYLTDDEGDTHRYIQGVIQAKPEILWQTLDNVASEQEAKLIELQFNDIVSGIDFDTPTE